MENNFSRFAGVFICILLFVSIVNCHQGHHQQQQQPQQQPPPVNHQQQQQFQQQQQQQQQHHQQQQQQPHQQHHEGVDQIKGNINRDHVYEHLDGIINKPKEQMTIDEQNFYYFKLHDYDNNNMLDGLELVSAFAHNEEHKDHEQATNNSDPNHHQPTPRVSDAELIRLIDEIMRDEDKNQDGYITYQEFLIALKQ